mgnify:CR=1 FL=1
MKKRSLILTLIVAVVVALVVCLAPQPATAGKGTSMTNKVTLAAPIGKLAPTAATPHCHMQKAATAAKHTCNHSNHKATDGETLVAKQHCKVNGLKGRRLSDGPVIPPDPTDCPAYCGSACGCKDCDS